MQCKYCGGEINLSVGRCIGCGRSVDDTADIRILHDLSALAEKYGLDPDSEKYDHAEQKPEPENIDQRTEAQILPKDFKSAVKPGIELQTYYDLLGEQDSEASPVPETEPEEMPEVHEEESEEISGDDGAQTPADQNSLRGKIENILDRVDSFSAPVTEQVRQWYNAKMPQLNRAKSSSKWERLAVTGLMLLAGMLVVVIVMMIIASIPSSISGEWRVSDENARNMFTVEFSGGEVTARVYGEDGEAHVYKKGTYDTSRKNGRDLLTIVYEDGSLSHLYYEISGRTGEFVNVDTGSSDTYRRVD